MKRLALALAILGFTALATAQTPAPAVPPMATVAAKVPPTTFQLFLIGIGGFLLRCPCNLLDPGPVRYWGAQRPGDRNPGIGGSTG